MGKWIICPYCHSSMDFKKGAVCEICNFLLTPEEFEQRIQKYWKGKGSNRC